MKRIFADGFFRNMIVVFLVTILLGSIFAISVGWAANFYFGQTLQSLIGDMGEYDLIISVRQSTEELAQEKLEEIINKELPGVKWKKGTSLAGKANFFLSFPAQYKTRQVWENLDDYFGTIPGKSGYTIMLEPRLTLRAVPLAIQDFLLDKLQTIPDIAFSFSDGGSLQLVLQQDANLAETNKKVKKILDRYSLFTIYFPLGYKPEDTLILGNQVASLLQKNYALTTSQNINLVAGDKKNQQLLSTLGEMKRFLLAYATQVKVKLTPTAQVAENDKLFFASAQDVLQIQKVNSDQAWGILIQGEGGNLLGQNVSQNGQIIGQVIAVENPREKLNLALAESINMLQQLEKVRKQALAINKGARESLALYQEVLPQITQMQVQMKSLKQQTASPLKMQVNVQPLDNRLTEMELKVNEINRLLQQQQVQVQNGRKQLEKQKILLGEQIPESIIQIAETIDRGYQKENYLLSETQEKLQNVGEDIQNARKGINNLKKVNSWQQINKNLEQTEKNVNSLLQSLQSFPALALQQQSEELEASLLSLGKLDQNKTMESLLYLQESLPVLKEEEIGSSVSLLNEYLGKQLTMDQGLVILTDNWLPKKKAEKDIQKLLKNNQISSLQAPVALVETDMRGEIQRIISSIREILSALSAIAFTLLILILDQTTIMSCLNILDDKKNKWWSLAHLYGVLVGSFLLFCLVIISKGAIPYLYLGHYLLLGGFLGYLVASQTNLLSPVDEKEITAGQALGLSYREIMEQIVIPTAKPGILKFCNRKKVKLQGRKKRC